MRALFALLIFIYGIFSSENSLAQKRTIPKATLTFYSTDSTPIHVRINDKTYNQYAQKISVGNVPGHKAFIEIFTLSTNKKGKSYLKKIYSGRIKIDSGKENFIGINPLNKSIKKTLIPPYRSKPNLNNEDSILHPPYTLTPKQVTNPELEKILKEINHSYSDEEKLAIILKKDRQWTFSDMLTLNKLLLFDESRLKFIRSQDLSNLSSQQIQLLQETFTSQEARNIFEQYK